MGGLFAGIQTALSSLQAEQQVQATAAHNLANASTPGYTRQQVQLVPVSYPLPGTQVQPGVGVSVAGIQRLRNLFLDLQYWSLNGSLGQYQTQQQGLNEVQASLAATGDTGLATALNQFWAAWQNVANNPESIPARQSLLQTAQGLTQQFNQLSANLSQERQNLDAQVRSQVAQVNQLAGQIAQLNGEIVQLSAAGTPPNDLLDQRDELVDRLSGYLPIQVTQLPNGASDVAVGNVNLVQGSVAQTINVTSNPLNNNFAALSWSGTGMALAPASGSLGALLTLRDTTLAGYQSQLDALAAALVTSVNGLHAAGYNLNGATGINFFAPGGTTAATIQVTPGLTAQQVAAAKTAAGVPGDNSNALAIADLASATIVSGVKPGDAFANLVSQVGADARAADQGVTNQQRLIQAISQQRLSTSGVSLDEEMTTMIQAQHAYEAAAQTINTINRMLDALVRLGQ